MVNKKEDSINRNIFLAVILLLAFFILYSLVELFTGFLASVMFYVLSKPSMEWLTRKKGWRKSVAAILVMLTSFFIILLPIGLLVALLYDKIVVLVNDPASVTEPVKHLAKYMNQRFNVQLISAETLNGLQTFAGNLLALILNSGVSIFTTITMMYFFLYFMLTNMNRMEAALHFYLPFPRNKIRMFGKELESQTFSNAVGVPLVAIVHGMLGFFCYLIVGLKDPAFWAVVTAFASVIPLVGTALVWLPASIYFFIMGNSWQGAFVLGWGALIMSTIDNIVRFLLAKRMADVHPVVTVLGVIIGLKYFGITGLIFGPVIISYFLILVRIYYMEYSEPSKTKKRTKK
jgi:predicted PurR-regulated permease PerM